MIIIRQLQSLSKKNYTKILPDSIQKFIQFCRFKTKRWITQSYRHCHRSQINIKKTHFMAPEKCYVFKEISKPESNGKSFQNKNKITKM